jgi:hypothetical protein
MRCCGQDTARVAVVCRWKMFDREAAPYLISSSPSPPAARNAQRTTLARPRASHCSPHTTTPHPSFSSLSRASHLTATRRLSRGTAHPAVACCERLTAASAGVAALTASPSTNHKHAPPAIEHHHHARHV